MIGRVLVIYFGLSVFLCDRQRPSFAGTDTEKFNFPNMVSDKCAKEICLLSDDKQFRFYRPSDFGVLRGEHRLKRVGL